jgi:hypothetical protein
LVLRGAKLQGDTAEQAARRDMYASIVTTIDPHTDWHRFATYKQLWYDASEEHDLLKRNLDSVNVQLNSHLPLQGEP